jgi:hypothetical protein
LGLKVLTPSLGYQKDYDDIRDRKERLIEQKQ